MADVYNEEVRSRVMAAVGRRDTEPEVRLRKALWALGYRYLVDARLPLKGIRRRADLVFRGPRAAVFVDGCFWHVCPEHGSWPESNEDYWHPKLRRNRQRDRETDEALREAGWTVVRIWEHEPVEEAVKRVVDELESSRS